MVNLSPDALRLIEKIRGIKGYESTSKYELIRALNASESVKTTRERRNENRDENKTLRDFDFIFAPEKGH